MTKNEDKQLKGKDEIRTCSICHKKTYPRHSKSLSN